MTQETINRLMELKKLLEEGILTQEEVEAEKKKILNTQQAQPVIETMTEQNSPTGTEVENHVTKENATSIPQGNEERLAFDRPKEEPRHTTEGNNPADHKNDKDNAKDDGKLRKWTLALVAVLVVIILIIAGGSMCSGSSSAESYDNEYLHCDSASGNDVVEIAEETTPYEAYEAHEDPSTNDDEFADDPWSRSFTIDGGIYRTCESRTMISLQKESGNLYSGDIVILCGSEEGPDRFDYYYGYLRGSVRGKRDGNQITIVIDGFSTESGSDGDYVNGVLKRGQQILKLTYDGYSYSATAIGNMNSFFDGYGPNVIN